MIPKRSDYQQRDYLRRVATQRAPLVRRGSTRIEALAVVILGLALVAFPWGRLGPSREAEAQPLSYVRLQDSEPARASANFDPANPQAVDACDPAPTVAPSASASGRMDCGAHQR